MYTGSHVRTWLLGCANQLLPRRRGQTLVLFTLMITAFFGFLALVIDGGFIFGQRRYDQNGADAATMAVARLMATNVAFANQAGTSVYFSVTDATVYATARQYGGLDPTSTTSTSPTGTNQNAQLDGQNQLKISLEYWDGTTLNADGTPKWCYSPSGPQPPRSPSVSACTMFVASGVNYPPQPTSNPYKVRVTVSSTTSGTFLSAAGIAKTTSSPTQSDSTQAACLVAGGGGMLTCAQAIATIAGQTSDVINGALIPTAAADCNVAVNPGPTLYQLWGSSGNSCNGFNFGNWDSLVDFSTEAIWCTNGTNPTYNYVNILPGTAPHTSYVGTCTKPPGWTETWNRTNFQADSSYNGTLVKTNDVVHWIALSFQGTLNVGNDLPTYLDSGQSSGNSGNNVAAGFYCTSSTVHPGSCDSSGLNSTGTYFFANTQSGFENVCTDGFSTGGAGCRDANIVTWINPLAPQGSAKKATSWQTVKNSPDKITIARILNFRFYCDHDANGCDAPPKSIVGNGSNSTVWGRFVGPFVSPCPTCTGGPSIFGNTVRFGG
jgi:hypothetical protein